MNEASIARRALLALLLSLGFYVLVVGVCAALVAVPFFLHGTLHLPAVFGKLSLFCIAAAGGLFVSALPRRSSARPSGVRLEAADQPRLFALIEEVARATGQPMPSQVLLTNDVNAAVFGLGGRLGFGQTRHLVVGLPLLQVLNERELRAVIAHEFGHFAGGDVRLGPWIHGTRASIVRSIVDLERRNKWLRAPFVAYGNLFLRVTLSVSRAQEYQADALSARVAGASTAISALRKIEVAAVAFEEYLHGEFVPVLQSGHRAPMLEGFERFLRHEHTRERLKARAREAAARPQDPYDTHPTLPLRVEALERQGDGGGRGVKSEPALRLLDELTSLETRVLRLHVSGADFPQLVDIRWDSVGELVRLPAARALRDQVPTGRLDGVRLGELGAVLADAPALGRWLWQELSLGPRDVEPEILPVVAQDFVQKCLLASLADAGWSVRDELGEALVARHGEHEIRPGLDVALMAQGESSAEPWRARCEAAGIAQLFLVRARAEPTAEAAAERPRSAARTVRPPPVTRRAGRSAEYSRDIGEKRHGRRAVVAGVALMAAALVVYFVWFGPQGPPPQPTLDSTAERFRTEWNEGRFADFGVHFSDESRGRLAASLGRMLERRGWTPKPPALGAARIGITPLDSRAANASFDVEGDELVTRWSWDGARWVLGSIRFPERGR